GSTDHTVRAWLGAEALAEGLSISAASLRPPVEAKHVAPRTTWTPDAVQRFMMATNPIPKPKKSEGALAPNGMMRMVLSHCPQWAPGVTLAVAQGGMALFCPMDAPKKALTGIAAKVKKDEDAGEADDVSVHLKGVFTMLPRVVLVDGGLVFTSDATVFEELRRAALGKPTGAAWWDDETPTTGLWMKAPQAVVSVVPDGSLNRAEMVLNSIDEFALLDSATIKVSTLTVEPREEIDELMERVEGGVVGGVIGGERVEPTGTGPGFTPPKVTRRVSPPAAGVDGRCSATFTLDDLGVPTGVTVDGPQCPEGYEADALPALMKWRFHPAADAEGNPVPATVKVMIKLVMRD
ncbi:MAG: hypothetical protein KDA24_03165, partial [Deltaproteobacteria bacterium]|nr:hypothetical protein [Deltaproteobacteria bacterium]